MHQLYKNEGRPILKALLRSISALQYTWEYLKSSTSVRISLICILNQVCISLADVYALQCQCNVYGNADLSNGSVLQPQMILALQ